MRIPGPDEASLRLVDAPAGAGRDAGLRASLTAGAVVSLEVREALGSGLYRVAIGQRLFSASSSFPLELGAFLKARVERSGDTLLLRLLSPQGGRDSAAAALSAVGYSPTGFPNDAASLSAIAALLREGMAPEPRALARVRRAALREAAEGGDWTELAARMEAKGLPAEGEALEAIQSGYAGRGHADRGKADAHSGQRRDSGGSDSGGEGDDLQDPPRAEAGAEARAEAGAALPRLSESADPGQFERAFPESELPRELGALLRGLVTRSGGGDPDPQGLPLALFNHLRGPEGSWVIVPFRFALDAVDFTGSFRILLPYVRGGPGRFEAHFAAVRGAVAEDWSCYLSFGGSRGATLRVVPPEGQARAAAEAAFSAFSAELAALSCSARISVQGAEGADSGSSYGGLDFDA